MQKYEVIEVATHTDIGNHLMSEAIFTICLDPCDVVPNRTNAISRPDLECPSCSSGHCTHLLAESALYCEDCGLKWDTRIALCPECHSPLRPTSDGKLYCYKCQANWELEMVKEAYLIGDL